MCVATSKLLKSHTDYNSANFAPVDMSVKYTIYYDPRHRLTDSSLSYIFATDAFLISLSLLEERRRDYYNTRC